MIMLLSNQIEVISELVSVDAVLLPQCTYVCNFVSHVCVISKDT